MRYRLSFGGQEQVFTERQAGIVFWILRERCGQEIYESWVDDFGDNVPYHDFEREHIDDEEFFEVGDMIMASSDGEYSDIL